MLYEMATTARRSTDNEDIAAIAKQISDHAEAIYQTWKSRGLAPAELLTCHANSDTLDKMLSPHHAQPTPSIELLAQAPTMDNNRLEKLVNNFVVEDKARQRNKAIPSSIQYALQKFEKNAAAGGGVPAFVKSSSVIVNNSNSSGSANKSNSASSTISSASSSSSLSTKSGDAVTQVPNNTTPMVKPAIRQKPQLSPKPRFSDTVEMTLPPDVVPNAWPLKNRVISTDTVKKTAAETANKPLSNSSASPSSSSYLDEVALEEKRLINALKNGVILNEESSIASPIATTPKTTSAAIVERENTRWGLRRRTASTEPQVQQQVVPHPELTTAQRQHLRTANPVRPFLTRGSVAERVLIFERCPSDLILDQKRTASIRPVSVKPQLPPKTAEHTTLQRHIRTHPRNVHIPRFFFPSGKPGPPGQLDQVRARVAAVFAKWGERLGREHFPHITSACQLPLYWKTPLFLAAIADKNSNACTFEQFMQFWSAMSSTCHDGSSRFVYILTRGRRQWLGHEDFVPLIQDVVETHPGLTFLKEATEFHSRYVHTVIARIFYCANRSWSGKITIPELRRSDLLAVLQLLEEEEDINQVTAYFSYEHFYVIYCKFWELDRDHDLFIDKYDLTRHSDHALSTRIIDRIFSGCVTRGTNRTNQINPDEQRMSYTEFVWFLLSEEDKLHPTAIEYWFRCMDLDGDGFLSMYELEYFYEEQMQRMEAIGIETLPFSDCLCQMLDMVKPAITGKIALGDLKKCRMTPIFFDTFFNLEKYLDHEQRDPFASQRDHGDTEMSDWDRFAAEEYELLVAEEGAEHNESISSDENNDEDLLAHSLDAVLVDAPPCLSDESDECSI